MLKHKIIPLPDMSTFLLICKGKKYYCSSRDECEHILTRLHFKENRKKIERGAKWVLKKVKKKTKM